MSRIVKIGNLKLGKRHPMLLVVGPCVIESRRSTLALAKKLVNFSLEEEVSLVFKASYDKANRSSHQSFRGPGIEEGLDILAEVREQYSIPVLTDVHRECDVFRVSQVVDVLQIRAFLCRQTDLLLAAGDTNLAVNVKKGQFLSPWDMANVIDKIESTGNRKIILTERGTSFGYFRIETSKVNCIRYQ